MTATHGLNSPLLRSRQTPLRAKEQRRQTEKDVRACGHTKSPRAAACEWPARRINSGLEMQRKNISGQRSTVNATAMLTWLRGSAEASESARRGGSPKSSTRGRGRGRLEGGPRHTAHMSATWLLSGSAKRARRGTESARRSSKLGSGRRRCRAPGRGGGRSRGDRESRGLAKSRSCRSRPTKAPKSPRCGSRGSSERICCRGSLPKACGALPLEQASLNKSRAHEAAAVRNLTIKMEAGSWNKYEAGSGESPGRRHPRHQS